LVQLFQGISHHMTHDHTAVWDVDIVYVNSRASPLLWPAIRIESLTPVIHKINFRAILW
jgi:hypothetical protein